MLFDIKFLQRDRRNLQAIHIGAVTGDADDTVEIDLADPLPIGVGEMTEVSANVKAGIVDENVDAAVDLLAGSAALRELELGVDDMAVVARGEAATNGPPSIQGRYRIA